MKCQSVACLWPSNGAPPLHKITASIVLNQPPTLYTGGSDGSIIWWNFSGNESKPEIWPMAMLCGHAAAIADLEICMPIGGEMENSSNGKSAPVGPISLISACTDGVLCVWSRGSGHCRRRRKMPPWVGTPSMMSSLPMSRRYVCISCNCVASSYHAAETADVANICSIQNENIIDRDTHYRRTAKCAVVIVDSCTLNIVQTIFHGSLSIGPLKFMEVVSEDTRKQSVILADTLGKVQSFAILNESDPKNVSGSVLQKSSSQMGISIDVDSSSDGVQAVSVATHGKLLALVFRTYCIFKSMTNETTLGEISLANSSLCNESFPSHAYIKGGTFLQIDYGDDALESFAVWSNTGAAMIYTISVAGDTFNFECMCKVPAISQQCDVEISVSFCQLNNYLLRIESICVDAEELLLWKPHVSIWLLCKPPIVLLDTPGNLGNNSGDPYSCIMLGEGGFIGDWIGRPFSHSKMEYLKNNVCLKASKVEAAESSTQSCFSSPTNLNISGGEHGDGLLLKGKIVSSSLVLSEEFYAPYAVVYGFYSGEIEVVRFETFFQELNFVDESLQHNICPRISEQSFSGHNGAVFCMAAHHMVNGQNFKQVLISGSSDCTVRIWDLDSGSLVSVMHHHVGPVRQIILPAPWTDHPWCDCFLSVGEDLCVALVSLETLRVERMFPGHPSCPSMVVWDSVKGYVACLCQNISPSSDTVNILYLWDVKTGARERVLRGTASHSMFDHFCRGINVNSITDNILGGTTSASSLLLSVLEDTQFSPSHVANLEKGVTPLPGLDGPVAHISKGKLPMSKSSHEFFSENGSVTGAPSQPLFQNKRHHIKCSCPFPGIATLKFDLSSLMYPCQTHKKFLHGGKKENPHVLNVDPTTPTLHRIGSNDSSDVQAATGHLMEEPSWVRSLEGCLLRFSLSFLHLWDVDHELDKLLTDEMHIFRPEGFIVSSGLPGDRGSLTLTFPGLQAILELWRSSSEFCAMRSLTMVSLAQRMISLSHSSSAASCALAAFYTRNFAEKVPDIKPPLLQLLVSFWQDPSEHVRMAARSLFHCAASRAVPPPLCSPQAIQHELHSSLINGVGETQGGDQEDQSTVLSWLESFEMQDWISCIGGTSQDAMASHIIVAAALVVWYPSLVKPNLSMLVVHPLMKLVMAMSDKYSSTAAELLAEGMESAWKACIGPEIPRLVGDIFFQIECVSGPSANTAKQNPSLAVTIRDTLVGILLPSLAMADITGFLNVIESQIWATSSDSPVHLVSLMTLVRVVRSGPKLLAPHLDKVINFVLQTMDQGNSVMRKACLHCSMAALRELVRVFPMIAFNEALTRLAVGEAIGDIHNGTIRVYDMQSVTKIKVLDASGPPGLPSLLGGASNTMTTTAISALSFSQDGEGLVAFSENGLMIRWWSLGTAWWDKLSRSLIPVQCTKLIFVPPWEGFSPNSSRSSVFAGIVGRDNQVNSQEKTKELDDTDSLKLLIHNLDLFYRLEWVGARKVVLRRHGHELGSFQL
ncbi:transducin/WD40 repeat-like superfamily protein [Tasmannia lanceolata]|uniref:transducin/WD40 repeat-like superfamily protein n=1 Tax=Tasmannia lanceolata TaxID=3420 RepID=UPI0040646016